MSFPSSPSSPSRRRLIARLAALSASLAALAPGAAHAADVGFTFGPYLSFVFGEEIGVGWGVDTTVLVAPGSASDTCSDGLGDDDWGIGPHLEIGAVNVSKFRMVAAVAAGGALADEDSMALLGEAGVALHMTREDAEPRPIITTEAGVHTGFVVQSPQYVRGFARAEWLLNEYSVGAAVGFPNLINRQSECSIGRPLRGADGAVMDGVDAHVAGETARGTGRSTTIACEDRAAIAQAWTDDAQGEAASIPAFLQLAAELLAHGAPDPLVARALDAAEDEIRHAAMCARQATRLGGRRVVPVVPPSPLRPAIAGVEGLARLAVESWLDGCLSEGAAAARAGWGAAHATDAASAMTQRRIHGDEARHAALGWDVLRWALRRGGARVVDAVAALRDVEAPAASEPRWDGADAVVFGRTPRRVAETLHEAHGARARRRLERVLAEAHAA